MPEITRLPTITLPSFARLSWSSKHAQEVWEPRLNYLRDVWHSLALELVRSAALPIIPLRLRASEYHALRATAARQGLRVREVAAFAPGVLPWNVHSRQREPGQPKLALIGTAATVEPFLATAIPAQREHLTMPECCRTAYWEERQDYWWDTAAPTIQNDSYSASAAPEATRALLFYALHIPTLWYLPCRLSCEQAAAGATQLEKALLRLGEHEAADWFANITRWPVAWSGLHGIAEIKTPVFKLIHNTDPTAEKLTVHLPSNESVEGGARGLHFPFMQPAHRNK